MTGKIDMLAVLRVPLGTPLTILLIRSQVSLHSSFVDSEIKLDLACESCLSSWRLAQYRTSVYHVYIPFLHSLVYMQPLIW